jgi:hypothetical protein
MVGSLESPRVAAPGAAANDATTTISCYPSY